MATGASRGARIPAPRYLFGWAPSHRNGARTPPGCERVDGASERQPFSRVKVPLAGGAFDTSIAATAMLVLAALDVLVAARPLHWGRVLDPRTGG